jgi:hypothetical protein
MILEIATAAAMYAYNSTTTAAESDIPVMVPALTCRYKDPRKVRQCLDQKMRPEPDPYAAMWDPNWVSTITYERKDVVQQHTAPKR